MNYPSRRKPLKDQPPQLGAARSQIAEALVRVAMWVGGLAGPALVAAAVLTSQPKIIGVGACTTLVGVAGFTQYVRIRPQPLIILGIASVNGLVLAPISDRVAHAAILPALTLFAFVGTLAMPRSTARWFSIWCGLVGVISLVWILPGVTQAEFVVGAIMLATIATAGWRFLSLAGDLLVREEGNHRLLFEGSPVALLEEDFTEVGSRLEALRVSGVADLDRHLRENRDQLREMVSTIGVNRANRAALQMIGAKSPEELSAAFAAVERSDQELESYLVQFVAIWDRKREIAVDLDGVTLDGDRMEAVLHWSAPAEGDAIDLSRVIVAISDITPRKKVEERLAHALEVNRSLLEFEHALALCSRSLLLGSGEEALEDALSTLREAIGADRAYLAVNLDDPTEGPSFHVVRSVSLPEFAEDEWMGKVIPWSKYPVVRDTLLSGDAFQHIGTRQRGTGWTRSVLTVPVFTEGRWAGSVGFMDMERVGPWSEEAVRMLEVAAPMLGTFWEREMTRQRLEELVMSKDRFVASVSHELRTPLAAVLGFAEELKSNAASFRAEELTDMLELIADQSQEMADMVEDLLVSARADIGTVSIRPQDVYLRSQAETVLAGLGAVGSKDIRVVGGRGRVWADPSRTRQIIRNLITNAIRYGGDQILVEAVESTEETVLTVVDDGPGLDHSQWEEIFEPYQRAHDAPTQPASIGLGLTVSRQLARLMGGDLIYSCDERGSVFSLTLPTVRGGGEDAPDAAGKTAPLAGAVATD